MTVKIALTQLACGPDVKANEQKHIAHIREAAANGAKIIGLQELFNAQYFPQTVAVEGYQFAAKIPSELTQTDRKSVV